MTHHIRQNPPNEAIHESALLGEVRRANVATVLAINLVLCLAIVLTGIAAV